MLADENSVGNSIYVVGILFFPFSENKKKYFKINEALKILS